MQAIDRAETASTHRLCTRRHAPACSTSSARHTAMAASLPSVGSGIGGHGVRHSAGVGGRIGVGGGNELAQPLEISIRQAALHAVHDMTDHLLFDDTHTSLGAGLGLGRGHGALQFSLSALVRCRNSGVLCGSDASESVSSRSARAHVVAAGAGSHQGQQAAQQHPGVGQHTHPIPRV